MAYTMEQLNAFVNAIGPLIVAEAKKRGYSVASPVIGQAILESGVTKELGVKYHNYFGLKCGTVWKGKSVNMTTHEEYTIGVVSTIKDNFRVYDTMAEGVAGYYEFISTTRYANLKSATTPFEYLTRIKADGYATDSQYVNKVMSVVNTYNLARFDSFDISKEPIKDLGSIVSEVINGLWGTGDARKQKLYEAGYDYDEVQKAVNLSLTKHGYIIGKTYVAKLSDMYIRKEPNGPVVKNGTKDLILQKNQGIVCRDIDTRGNEVWMKTDCGWICAVGNSGKKYLQ